jgi:hypothetical protein
MMIFTKDLSIKFSFVCITLILAPTLFMTKHSKEIKFTGTPNRA